VCHTDENHIHVTVFNTAYFFTAYHLTEYTAFDRETFSLVCTAASNRCRVFIDTGLNHQGVVSEDGCEFCTHDYFL
jgi:hypothetical protein